MARAPIIHPYARFDAHSQKALDKIDFHFTSLHLARTSEGWLRLSVDWNAQSDDAYKVKYPERDGTGSGSGGGSENDYVHFMFPQVPAPYKGQGDYGKEYKAHVDIGIEIRTGRRLKPPRLGYEYAYHQNTKYGVAMYFHPRGWDQGKDKTLYSWRARRQR